MLLRRNLANQTLDACVGACTVYLRPCDWILPLLSLKEQLRRNFANENALRKGTRQQTFIYKSVTGNYQGPFQELSFQK